MAKDFLPDYYADFCSILLQQAYDIHESVELLYVAVARSEIKGDPHDPDRNQCFSGERAIQWTYILQPRLYRQEFRSVCSSRSRNILLSITAGSVKDDTNMGKILVVGSLNVDMVMNVDHMPAEGETIYVMA